MQRLLCCRVPAADGVMLATDVYRPTGPGPHPVVLVRTPYHRKGLENSAPGFVERGYALVAQDCRGKYDSDGHFEPLVHEAADGQATLDWIANQRWCNGRIGMWGRSYLGIVQVPAASSGHPALRCIVPSVAPGSFCRDWIRYDGCFALGNAIRWSLSNASCRTQPPMQHVVWDQLQQLSGPDAIAAATGFATPVLGEWARHDTNDAYWQALDQCAMHSKVAAPGLHVGGWFDHLTRGQYEAFSGIRDSGASAAARQGQRLLIGPWGHQTAGGSGPGHTRYGEWDFGPEADFPVLAHELQFLDYHLRELDQGFSAQPPVRVFIMGANRWEGLADWPPPHATVQQWFLDSGGSANMHSGDGVLSQESPAHETADTLRHDPTAPVPTRGGAVYWGLADVGPVDLRPILTRPDVLYYRGAPLAEAMTVLGEPGLEIWAATDADDTDFIARLCVEQADGKIICLCLGSLRCRYRHSWESPQAMAPGTAEPLSIRLGEIGYRFEAGSRLALVVASSDYPRIQPHPGSMAAPWDEDAPRSASNRVLHGPGARSCLKLPVVELD
jgi:uncharacterized protein